MLDAQAKILPTGKSPNFVDDENKTWSAFTQETTFHGVKFIFDPSGLVWRRILWSTVVLSSMLIFTIQVSFRIVAYKKYDTTTDLSAEYPENLRFPAVSICNQNSFRISETEQRWYLYDFVDTIYRNRVVDQRNITSIDGRQFFQSAAHELSDLVERCEWRGVACDNERDFIQVIGESGVCYVFNSGVNTSVLSVEQAGSQSKLELVLNAETYEHMRGPQNDAGIKIQLHNHDDLTQLETKGFMVAPGKHVLVRIEMSKAKFLPSPYGECEPDIATSRASCISHCRSGVWAHDCGCAPPNLDDAALASFNISRKCSVANLFECMIDKQIGVVNATQCSCPAPCQWTEYTPISSFADLSKYNIRRLVFDDAKREERVYAKFMNANEVRARAVRDIYERDGQLIRAFQAGEETASEVVHDAVQYLDSGLLKRSSEALGAAVEEDKQALNRSMVNLWWRFARTIVKVTDIGKVFQDNTFERLTMYEGVNVTYQLEQCYLDDPNRMEQYWTNDRMTINRAMRGIVLNANDGAMMPGGSSDPEEPEEPVEAASNSSLSSINDWLLSSLNSTSTARRKRSVHSERYKRSAETTTATAISWVSGPFDIPASSSNLTGTPRNMGGGSVTASSGGSSSNYGINSALTIRKVSSSIGGNSVMGIGAPPSHPCYDLFQHVVNSFKNEYRNILDALENLHTLVSGYDRDINITYAGTGLDPDEIAEHPSCRQTLQAIEEHLKEFSNDPVLQDGSLILFDDLLILMNNLTAHSALSLPLDLQQNAFTCFWIARYISLSMLEKMLQKMDSATNTLYSMPGYSFQLSPLANEISALLGSQISRASNTTKQYEAIVLTKHEMAEVFDSAAIKISVSTISEKTSGYSRTGESMTLDFRIAQHQVEEVIDEIYSSPVPLMNGETLTNLALRQSAQDVGYTANGTGTRDEAIHLVEFVFLHLVGYDLNNFTKPLVSHMTNMTEGIERLSKMLLAYIEETQFDTDVLLSNFLKVDIFFDELKWTQVTQKESFGILSLFGEIGGFLGLLLGASVLTVCELLDFLSSKVSEAWKRRKASNSGKENFIGSTNKVAAWHS